MAVSLRQFVERLTRSGLFSAEELAAFQAGLPPEKQPRDAQGLARELILADRLTRFQAEAVYRGRTKGLVMGEYVVQDRIGAGGMGEVLKAQHRRMKRVVALKVLPAKAMKSQEAVRRFYREVEAAARLIHPNIVTAFDAGECEGIHYLVMEHVDGQDLAHLVKQHGPMSVDQAIECTVQAARGLAYAHAEGVIHRDIKPGNLLLTRKKGISPISAQSGSSPGQDAQQQKWDLSPFFAVKILDMGLARLEEEIAGAGGEVPERLTSSGQIMGTVDYIAPEQAEDTHAADHRADVYSLGCTLCRLLTGRPPYSAETPVQVVLAHIQKPVPSIRAVRPDVPEALDAVVRKMLAKRPEDRYQSMDEVIDALEACRQGGPAAPVGAEAPSDSALTSFFEQLAGGSTGTKQRQATLAEDTLPSASEVETGAKKGISPISAPYGVRGKKDRKQKWDLSPFSKLSPAARRNLLRYVGIGGGAALCLVLLGLLIVVLRGGGSDSPLPSAGDRVGKGSPLPSAGEGPGVRVSAASQQPPPLAVAPFDARRARWYQQQWADYLGVPVEWDNSIGMTFVLIPPGEFSMGSTEAERQRAISEAKSTHDQWAMERTPSEQPQHPVKITRPFYLGKLEVTQAQWQAVMGNNPSEFQGPANPVERVSWDDVQLFLAKLKTAGPRGAPSSTTARTLQETSFALPTEAQWEYACRAGTTTEFSLGESATMLGQCAWFLANSDGKSHAAGRLKPNAWGLCDMHGNVWEWCADGWGADYYGRSPASDPPGPPTAAYRVNRGGGWGASPMRCRSARRDFNAPDDRRDYLGFRLACEIPTDPAALARFAAAIRAAKPEKVEPPPEHPALVPDEPPPPAAGSVTATLRAALGDFSDAVSSMAFASDGRKLTCNGNGRGMLAVWDVIEARKIVSKRAHNEHVRCVAFADDGRLVAAGTYRRATVWTPDNGDMRHTYRTEDNVWSVAFGPAGRLLATGDGRRILFLWDVPSATMLWRKPCPTPKSMVFSPDGTLLVTGGDGTPPGDGEWRDLICLWDVATGKERGQFVGHQDRVLSIDLSGDGRLLASGSKDKTARLWSVATRKQWLALDHPDEVLSVSLSPDTSVVATGCKDGKVRLWSARDGKLLQELDDHTGAVHCVAFAPQGDILATGGEDKTIKLWDVKIAPGETKR